MVAYPIPYLILGSSLFTATQAFLSVLRPSVPIIRASLSEFPLAAAAENNVSAARRKELLSRKGPYFKLNRMAGGTIEFGATANLITTLEGSPAPESIAAWLEDERSLALSIWDPNLVKDRGDSVYRLQIMTLQFVTLQLAPWVDVRMKTVLDSKGQPVFTLQSIGFDPNIQILPGMRIDAKSLGIVIEVSGFLRPLPSEQSVTGSIAFTTAGKLPPPLLLLPESVLKAASDAINDTVAQFAAQSFQKGAKENFKDFMQRYEPDQE